MSQMIKISLIALVAILFFASTGTAKTVIKQTLSPTACFGEYECRRWYKMYEKEDPDSCNYETPCGRWYIETPTVREIVLRGINFEFDKYTIRKESYPILDANVATLMTSKSMRIHIIGHTDAIASDEYNYELSVKRAKSVRDYLVQRGISPKRMRIEGRGEKQPVAQNNTLDGRAQNRRIVIQF